MKNFSYFLFLFLLSICIDLQAEVFERKVLFDEDWHFSLGNMPLLYLLLMMILHGGLWTYHTIGV